MKNITPPLVLILVLFFSCKKDKTRETQLPQNVQVKEQKVVPSKPKQELQEVIVHLNNIKSRDTVFLDKRRFLTEKTSIYAAISDSLEIFKKTIFSRTPKKETLRFKIAKNDFINLRIDATLEKNNYFLKGGDTLTINFNTSGFVEKSILNGSEETVALIFSKNNIPNKSIEYIKHFMKQYGNVNDKIFDKRFEKRFQKELKQVSTKIKKSGSKLPPIILKALKKHLEYAKIKNNLAKGIEQKIPYDDFSMSIIDYRSFDKEMLSKVGNVNYIDNEKVAIEEAIRVIGYLMNDTSFKNTPKTRNMLLRELIKTTGHYEPNLIPELMDKISDTEIRNKYKKTYTNQYLLNLNKFRNDTKNLNLISIKNPEKVFSFQKFLDENKGKVVYVDLWASWCGPCRKQLVSSHKLRKELAKEPVVFSYFSTDKSFSKWKTAQLEEEMGEEPNSFLLINTKASNKYKSWNVKQIPRYLIFDKTGKLVIKDAPIPSDPKAKEALLKYIRKNI